MPLSWYLAVAYDEMGPRRFIAYLAFNFVLSGVSFAAILWLLGAFS